MFGDEYKGLWKICYDRPNRGLESSCFERVGDGKTYYSVAFVWFFSGNDFPVKILGGN